MCFYDQIVFSCGDYKWGHFRHHCNRKYRTSETCGIKLIMHTLRVDSKCKRCEKLDTTYRRRQAEAARIASWLHGRRNVPLLLANCHVQSRPTVSGAGVPSMISAGGDTLQVGSEVGFSPCLDIQGISSPGYPNADHGQWYRTKAFGAFDDIAAQDSAQFRRNRQGNGEDLGLEHQSRPSDSVIDAYQSAKTWCQCGNPSPHYVHECLSTLLRAPNREAKKPASKPEEDDIGSNPQKNRTIRRHYLRNLRIARSRLSTINLLIMASAHGIMLRKLLQYYQLMEDISSMSPESINDSLAVIRATPFQPLAQILAFTATTTPRHWLGLRKVIPFLYSDVLSSFSEITQEALFYTDELRHAQQQHSNFPRLITNYLQYILARRMVLCAIQYKIYASAPTPERRDNIKGLIELPARERHHHRQICHAKQRNFNVLLFTLHQNYAICQERWNGSSRSLVFAGTVFNPH